LDELDYIKLLISSGLYGIYFLNNFKTSSKLKVYKIIDICRIVIAL
jgi:hypothetical protein